MFLNSCTHFAICRCSGQLPDKYTGCFLKTFSNLQEASFRKAVNYPLIIRSLVLSKGNCFCIIQMVFFFCCFFFHFRRVISVLIDCACCQWKRNTFVHLMPSMSYETIWIKKKKNRTSDIQLFFMSPTRTSTIFGENYNGIRKTNETFTRLSVQVAC